MFARKGRNWKQFSLLPSVLLVTFYGVFAQAAPVITYGHDPALTGAYLEACGDCHYAYPPQLLPPQSWQRVMASLDNHFDDNAELEPEDWQTISQYLDRLSGVAAPLYRKKYDGEAPTRITKLRYFAHEHHGFPRAWVEDNDKVMSLGNCNACHRVSSRGYLFDEHSIRIPGVN